MKHVQENVCPEQPLPTPQHTQYLEPSRNSHMFVEMFLFNFNSVLQALLSGIIAQPLLGAEGGAIQVDHVIKIPSFKELEI